MAECDVNHTRGSSTTYNWIACGVRTLRIEIIHSHAAGVTAQNYTPLILTPGVKMA